MDRHVKFVLDIYQEIVEEANRRAKNGPLNEINQEAAAILTFTVILVTPRRPKEE